MKTNKYLKYFLLVCLSAFLINTPDWGEHSYAKGFWDLKFRALEHQTVFVFHYIVFSFYIGLICFYPYLNYFLLEKENKPVYKKQLKFYSIFVFFIWLTSYYIIAYTGRENLVFDREHFFGIFICAIGALGFMHMNYKFYVITTIKEQAMFYMVFIVNFIYILYFLRG